jgi:hypothetical protein
MRTLLLTFVIFTGVIHAEDKTREDQPSTTGLIRRLESVSWDPIHQQLSWVMSVWDPQSSTSKPAKQELYSADLVGAEMKFEGEHRSFDETEAHNVRTLMQLISLYAAQSTVRWRNGESVSKPEPEQDSPALNKFKIKAIRTQ